MARGADLFIVCKNPECRSEVSPYVTECPYCGTRLRKRAPKLERGGRPGRSHRRVPAPGLSRLRADEIPGIRGDSRPYATAALLLATCGVWIAWQSGAVPIADLGIDGPLDGHLWRALTAQFTYVSGVHQFGALAAIGLFGWLLERRHGPIVVLLLFVVCGCGGVLIEAAASDFPLSYGADGAALGLLAAWAAPDLTARIRHNDYEGDLLGAGMIALALALMPLARTEASWLAGIAGGLIGLGCGLALARLRPD